MDERAKIPVTLPRDNPTAAFWQDPPDASVADVRSTPNLPESADVVIIGSGITGAAVAWHLLSGPSPPSSVLMLEARQACSGATGRNGKSISHLRLRWLSARWLHCPLDFLMRSIHNLPFPLSLP